MANETLFLDTAYVLALFNTRDQWHQNALEWQQRAALENSPLLTTEFVFAEIGDGLSSRNLRANAARIIHALVESALVDVIPANSDLFRQGLRLFGDRLDKDWGITDCTSFVVMQERGVTKALTNRRAFPTSWV